jgi:carboxypeptidase Q
MKKKLPFLLVFFMLHGIIAFAQTTKDIVDKIVKEANENSQLEPLAHELMDVIGPRLVGTPQMQKAHNWAVEKYAQWGITAKNEKWGQWRGWERGITHVDLVSPRVVSLSGMQLAWSPSTPKKGITAGMIIIPDVADSLAFKKWLPNVKGKFVMVSMIQPTGRPDYNWEEYATKESFEKIKILVGI